MLEYTEMQEVELTKSECTGGRDEPSWLQQLDLYTVQVPLASNYE